MHQETDTEKRYSCYSLNRYGCHDAHVHTDTHTVLFSGSRDYPELYRPIGWWAIQFPNSQE